MIGFKKVGSNFADAVTGERIFPGETVFDTGIRNQSVGLLRRGKTRFVKEETIVWLAEQAGYTVTKGNGGTSKRSARVDKSDVGVGGGEGSVGEVEVGGVEASDGSADGTVED